MLETVIKRDRDLGTPARKSAQTVTLTIDGQEITVPEGSSLMRAAAEAGINIPKLCATDSLEPFGSCRLCLVQIDGRRGYPASCTTPAEHGMVVHTETPKLRELRRGVMELYISDHPLDCLTCPANGDCELQDMAGVVACGKCATATRAPTTWTAPRTSPIRTSPTTRPSASSATAACAPARKPRAPTP